VIPTRRLDSFMYEAAQNLSLFKYSNLKLKNQKPIAVEVLYKAYPKVPLLSQIFGKTEPEFNKRYEN
jgi:hypothetical protein